MQSWAGGLDMARTNKWNMTDRDYLHPHSPSQTIAHNLWLGNQQPLFTPITQISALLKERDFNNDILTPDPLLQEPLSGQWLLHGKSLERWLKADLHPKLVVLRPYDGMQHIFRRFKRQREESEQEKAPRKKRTSKQYKYKTWRQEDDT